MNGQRQNIQYSLVLEPKGRGETPAGGYPRAEPFVAKPAPESPAASPLTTIDPALLIEIDPLTCFLLTLSR